MLKKLATKIVVTLLGMVLVLTWWTVTGSKKKSESVDQIPAAVWGGGPTKITVEADTNTPATMSIDFNQREGGASTEKMLQTYEKMIPGKKIWTVEVPDRVGGYIELEADKPEVGAKLRWRVLINGSVVGEDEDTLDKPLENGTAMFLQLHFDDYSKAHEEANDNE